MNKLLRYYMLAITIGLAFMFSTFAFAQGAGVNIHTGSLTGVYGRVVHRTIHHRYHRHHLRHHHRGHGTHVSGSIRIKL